MHARVIKQTMQRTYPYAPAATLIIQRGARVFSTPHSQRRARSLKKKESMNISLSGNSGSGDCRQEFWLAGEDLQNVGREPRGCLASWTGNSLQNLIFTLILMVQGTCPWPWGGGVRTRMRRETERGKAKEVHCNRRLVKKKRKKKERDPGESALQQQPFQATSPPGCSGTHAAVGALGQRHKPENKHQHVLLLLRKARWCQVGVATCKEGKALIRENLQLAL